MCDESAATARAPKPAEVQATIQAVRRIGFAVWLPVALLTWGCVTQSASILPERSAAPSDRVVQVQPCRDRSGFTGRNLEPETTRTLIEKVRASGLFKIRDGAPVSLICDIEKFEEGSALKRWVWPTWGATIAQVAVSVWEQPGDRVLATFRGQASVRAGGLYTVGADQYILGVAVDAIVAQMKAWVSGPIGAPLR